MRYIVAYDISNSKRRERLRKLLKTFGHPAQKSVFECDLRPREADRMIKLIQKMIHAQCDNVRIYPLCEKCVSSADLFGGREIEKSKSFYLI